ncbi:MAG: phosphatidylglycerophosphatase A [Sedimentisphaerales bacterium]|nr:phosphatidylglycerophosphatase A [Sedimentisphaerales bacterium]
MKRLLLTCFGLGWLPVAPGTWGSVPVAAIYVILCRLGQTKTVVWAVMAGCCIIASIICVKFAHASIAATGKKDPSEVVADEFAGQAVTFLVAAIGPIYKVWLAGLLGFVLFRLFDVVKPWPVGSLEKLPAGWGILADDLMAGIYAGIVLVFAMKLLTHLNVVAV